MVSPSLSSSQVLPTSPPNPSHPFVSLTGKQTGFKGMIIKYDTMKQNLTHPYRSKQTEGEEPRRRHEKEVYTQ